jgi:hypothetical protein
MTSGDSHVLLAKEPQSLSRRRESGEIGGVSFNIDLVSQKWPERGRDTCRAEKHGSVQIEDRIVVSGL